MTLWHIDLISAPISAASSRRADLGSHRVGRAAHGAGERIARKGSSSGRRSSWCTTRPSRSAPPGSEPGRCGRSNVPPERTGTGPSRPAGPMWPGSTGSASSAAGPRARGESAARRGRAGRVAPSSARARHPSSDLRVRQARDRRSPRGPRLGARGISPRVFLKDGTSSARHGSLGRPRTREAAGAPSPGMKRDRSDTDEFATRRWSCWDLPKGEQRWRTQRVVKDELSVDGVFEDPGGAEDFEHGGWTSSRPRRRRQPFKLDELMDSDVQLLGRVTYEGFAAAWPSREGPFAEKLNNDPKSSSRTRSPIRNGRTRRSSRATSSAGSRS